MKTDGRRAASVVCLHGFTGTPDAFRGLSRGPLYLRPLWAPYLPGHGTEPDLSSLTFDEEVQRLAAGITERAREPVDLLGYSMGARLALGLLQLFPHLFNQATLVGVNPGLESDEARQDRLVWEAQWIEVLERDGLAVFEQKWQAQRLFETQLSMPSRSQDAQKSARLSHTAKGLVHALRVLGLGSMPNFWPCLESVKTPLTLVYGERDEKFSAIAMRAQSVSSQIRTVAIPTVGHNPLIEAPQSLAEILAAAGAS